MPGQDLFLAWLFGVICMYLSMRSELFPILREQDVRIAYLNRQLEAERKKKYDPTTQS